MKVLGRKRAKPRVLYLTCYIYGGRKMPCSYLLDPTCPPQRDQAFVLGLGWMGASPEGGRSPLDCKSRPWSAIRQGEGDIEIDE
jgi:hypothetical protein